MKHISPENQAAIRLGYVSEDDLPNKSESSVATIWKKQLLTNASGKPIGNEYNVLQALRYAPELHQCAGWNEFANRTEVARQLPWRSVDVGEQWTDVDDYEVTCLLQELGIPARGGMVSDAVTRVAKEWPYHPVRDYLMGLQWDGQERLSGWLSNYLGAQANPDYLSDIGTAFLISAVARIFEPGCQADHVPVFGGDQGVGKTQAVKTLGGPWTTDSLPDLHSKDAVLQLSGCWLVELAELAAMRKSDIEATKGFITRRFDRFRPPYGRHAVEIPRQCVFIATTNEESYLRDPTGNRRFWPVTVSQADIEALARDRDQLWAEAVSQYESGTPWYLHEKSMQLRAEHEQRSRESRTELEQEVFDFLHYLESKGTLKTTTRDVFTRALGLNFPEDSERSARLGPQVSSALRKAGWKKTGVSGRAESRRTVYEKKPCS